MAQRSTTTAFAKSTRPEIGGVVLREALFGRLDGTTARTVAWISAPPGFGKTTLAASYLEARSYRWAWYQVDADDDDGETFLHYLAHAMRKLRGGTDELPVFGPEHRANPAAFARRYFRAMFSGVAGPMALVLDNLHELSTDSPLRAILEAGLPEVPRQCCVIVTSRAAPPSALARLQPGGQMVCLDAEALRITPEELGVMARLRGRDLDPASLQRLHRHADGWAAVLVLMVEHQKLSEDPAAWPAESTPKVVFDYLAGEIFERFDTSTQRLLMQIACLPRVTIEVARALTADAAVARVLFNLSHNDYFVRELVGPEGRVFVFHPLLREFLLRRAARDLPQAVGAGALRRAAGLLRESGQVEDAIGLLVECRDWHDVGSLVAEQAESLLAQGRHVTLAAWLELLPPALLGQDPALLSAHGAALAQASPRTARRKFEEAFNLYRRDGDRDGQSRCCERLIEAVMHEFDDLVELDRWLLDFDSCSPSAGDGERVPDAVLLARLWREPAHASLTHLVHGRDPQVARSAAVLRCAAALARGEFARAASFADGADPPDTPARLALALTQALRKFVEGDCAAALAAARAGLEIGVDDVVHGHDVWFRLVAAAAALAQDDLNTARDEIEAAESMGLRRGDRAFVQGLRGELARRAGDPGLALRETRSAAVLATEAGLPWLEALARLALAQLLAAGGDRPGAEAQARRAQAMTQRLASPPLQLSAWLTVAGVALGFDDELAAVEPLRAGLALARELGVHHVVGVPPELLGRLCAMALRRGIAADHARTLIQAGRLTPPAAALRIRQWPWAFEIRTLGGFELRRGNEPIEFSAKGPGRPVELLKVLISLGGQGVRADQLADALWPHVDADYAHKSFTATLHRLRKIFGGDDTLHLRDGRLSLDGAVFRLDAWALEHLLNELDTRLREGELHTTAEALSTLVDEMLQLYRGPFLPDESEQPAYIAKREQLRARLLRALTRVARRWEEGGRSDAAVDCYLRCIDADELCEAFYRNLMLCYQRHGDPAEALATYGRLQAVLSARLRSEPSPETQAIHALLRG